eukprot:8981-Heterococcus_DN1.PRE.1
MTLSSAIFESPARVKLAHKNGMNFSIEGFQLAAGRHGTAESLATARELGLEYTHSTMLGAAICNTLPVLQFLHAQGCPWGIRISGEAARRGDLDMLRWLHVQGREWDRYEILDDAARSGNLELIAWVKQQPGVVCGEGAMLAAAGTGQTAVCAYLHAEQCPWSALACRCAALYGHANTLRWLHENGSPWDVAEVCAEAAESGSVDVMMYLQQHAEVNLDAATLTEMLNIAGAHNHLAATQWLREQGAEWPAVLRCGRLFCSSVWSGDLLQWARSQGCTSPTQ